ncbi:MAG: prolyl oligopeptidase family serine peptidase, partial [Candidatus Nitrosopolaris sp.]
FCTVSSLSRFTSAPVKGAIFFLMLIIQGANDPKVVKYESDQIVERLRSKGIGVEYLIFDDEGHGFTKYSNLIKALKKSAEFLANGLSLKNQLQ